MPMKRNRGKAASLGPNTKNPGGFKPVTRHNERDVKAGGAYTADAPGLARDATPRIIRGPGR